MKGDAWVRLRKTQIALLAGTALCLSLPCPAAADSVLEPRSNLGGVGLIDMPSARMAPDGEIGVGASFLRNNQHYNFTFQALPWLETDFRYSGLGRNFAFAGFPVYFDRAIALKARLWEENGLLPSVALGINDVVGTGIYAGEYLVASKRFGPLDATLGIGWGRLGTANQFKNPFASIAPSFERRGTAMGGQANFGTFFHGPSSGLFGGVVYHTPINDLSLIAEYSSDGYVQERLSRNLVPRNQINFGASYRLGNASLGLSWLYGTTLSGSIAFLLDPVRDPFPQRLGSEPIPPAHLRSEAEQQLALERLLQQRQQAGTLALSSRGLNALSDTLFAQTSSVTDVSVRGRTLALSIDKGDVRAICDNTAAMAARAEVDIEAVVATDAAGRSARCAVQRRSGNTLVKTVELTTNPYAAGSGARMSAALLTIDASAPAQPSTQSAIAAIKADAAKNQVIIQTISLTDSEAVVYYSNQRYPHEDDAVRRLVSVLMADAPPSIEKFRLLPVSNDVPLAEFDVLRAPTERSIAQTGSYSLLGGGNELTDAPMDNPVLSAGLRGAYPKFSWSIYPSFRQQLFDPNNPFAVQFLVAAAGVVSLQPGLTAILEGELNLYDNFNVNRPSDSVLPHVRTDWARFFTEGKNGIGQFELNYLTRLAPDVYAQARVGYLENMYAGIGGEVLWRPQGQRWALGGDLYHVKERAFDRLLGFQNYQVTTGHVTLYYASPWYGMNFQLRAGQYLAGDRGMTFAISRTFSTGVELGVFVTKTNVSSAQFGEGSFDKGFVIKIPLGWVLPISTQSGINTIIRPVQRDGGQILAGDANIYGYLQRSGTAEIFAHEQDALDSGQ